VGAAAEHPAEPGGGMEALAEPPLGFRLDLMA
jgi:hypothetical protein